MLNWFSQNYSWIFSGIGVLVLGWGAAFLYRNVRNRRRAIEADALRDQSLNLALGRGQVVESNLAVGSNISQIVNVTKNIEAERAPVRKRHPAGPTPLEALEYQRRLPPYQRNEAMQHYFGLRVGLPVQFVSVSRPRADLWMAMFTFFGESERGVSCPVYVYLKDTDIKQFPRLKTLTERSWVWIEGKVGFRSDLFTVVVDKIEFD